MEITLVHGQQIAPPEAHLRCNVCDELEVEWLGVGPFRFAVATTCLSSDLSRSISISVEEKPGA
jgi:hypothetical protein